MFTAASLRILCCRSPLLLPWLAVLTAVPSYAADLPPTNLNMTIDSVQTWDSGTDAFQKFAWVAHSLSETLGKDSRGRTVDDDWNEVVMPPDLVKRLDDLRAKAGAQSTSGDTAGLQGTFHEASPLLELESYRAMLVMNYWGSRSALGYHQRILEPWLLHAAEEQKKAVVDHTSAAERSLLEALNAGVAEKSFGSGQDALERLAAAKAEAVSYYNGQRRALVDQQSKLPEAPALKSRTREATCPPPVAPLAGKGSPSLAPDNAAPEEAYPPLAKASGAEGTIMLEVAISETGCMQHAQVIGTSGVDELDEAALRWAENARFVPAEKDHKPVAGSMKFRMKFELRD